MIDKQALIDNYSDENFMHLGALKHMRVRTSMYLGSVANPQHTFEESLMNSIDEATIGVADQIIVHLYPDHSISVMDNGRGMPVDYSSKFKMPTVRALMTIPNTGKSFLSNSAGTSQNGDGQKATVATSDWFEVNIFKNKRVYYDRYECIDDNPGVPTVELTKDGNLPYRKAKEGEFEHGTMVHWLPSKEVWDSINFKEASIKRLLDQQAYLDGNLTLTFIDSDDKKTVFHHEDGIAGYLKDRTLADVKAITPIYTFQGSYTDSKQMINPVTKVKSDLVISAKVAFCYVNGDRNDTYLFTNKVPNPNGGTPVKGLENGISVLLNKYAKDFNLYDKTIEMKDVRCGLVAAINLTHPAPNFEGQTKKQITSTNAKSALKNIVTTKAPLVIDRNIEPITKLIKTITDRIHQRELAEKATDLSSKKVLGKLSQKLAKAKVLGENSSIYITEGDSASGGAKRTRDKTQAVMPIRGKIINSLKKTKQALINEEAATIFSALGTGIGANYDESKLNYGKVVIMTDADDDGAHIATLLLTLFMKFTPDLVKHGHVYRVISPLYVDKNKNNSYHFCYTETEQKYYLKDHQPTSVQRLKGLGEMDDKLVKKTLMTPGSRRLVQYKIKDFDDASQLVDHLMGSSVDYRKAIFTGSDDDE